MENQNRVRISVANLASYLMNNDTGEVVAIGVANKKRFEKNGEIFLQALGGAATMSTRGKEDMEQAFGAKFLEEGISAYDARFTIPIEYTKEVLGLFMGSPIEEFCESDPMREVEHELTQDTFSGSTILQPLDFGGMSFIFEGTFEQEVSEGKSTSERAASQDIPTRRLFFVHTLCVSGKVFDKILSHPCAKVLSANDLETTQMGRTKGSTGDGLQMSDNLCDWVPGHIM